MEGGGGSRLEDVEERDAPAPPGPSPQPRVTNGDKAGGRQPAQDGDAEDGARPAAPVDDRRKRGRPEDPTKIAVERASGGEALGGGRFGGVYIPPYKLAQMMKDVDRKSDEYQRMTWEALKKAINGARVHRGPGRRGRPLTDRLVPRGPTRTPQASSTR